MSSIKRLLSQVSSTLDVVNLSDLREKHRLTNYAKRLSSMPFARNVGEFVKTARYGSEPHLVSVQKAQKSLHEFMQEHESQLDEYADMGMAKVDLTKRWIVEHDSYIDCVALARSPDVALDEAVVNFVLFKSKDMVQSCQNMVVNEFGVRLVHLDEAIADPKSVSAFVNAMPTLAVNNQLDCMQFVIQDMVELSNLIADSWPSQLASDYTYDHKQLADNLRHSLTAIAQYPNAKLMMAVARSVEPNVQNAVRTVAQRVGFFDPGLQSKVEAVCQQTQRERERVREVGVPAASHGFELN